MMILSSLSSGTPTPVDTSRWLPTATYKDPPFWTVDAWANKIVFLLGTVHHLWCRIRCNADKVMIESHRSEWQYLSVQILRHETVCPITCRPLSAVLQNDFEAIGYSNGSVAAAWQMYHTLALVHATCDPSIPTASMLTSQSVRPKVIDLARKIVANSATNRAGTAWVNAVQLLTMAGQYLVERQVRSICEQTLKDIRKATGWDTTESLAMLAHVWEI